jgi:hypothetical protein
MAFLIATAPVFLQIVKHRCAFVISAGLFMVLLLNVILSAALVDTSELAFFGFE